MTKRDKIDQALGKLPKRMKMVRKYFTTEKLKGLNVLLYVEVLEELGGLQYIQGDQVWCNAVNKGNRRITEPAYRDFYKKVDLISVDSENVKNDI
jgi:hypothetical protein